MAPYVRQQDACPVTLPCHSAGQRLVQHRLCGGVHASRSNVCEAYTHHARHCQRQFGVFLRISLSPREGRNRQRNNANTSHSGRGCRYAGSERVSGRSVCLDRIVNTEARSAWRVAEESGARRNRRLILVVPTHALEKNASSSTANVHLRNKRRQFTAAFCRF